MLHESLKTLNIEKVFIYKGRISSFYNFGPRKCLVWRTIHRFSVRIVKMRKDSSGLPLEVLEGGLGYTKSKGEP